MTGKPLAGKVALITGGSRGIGRAICLKLAEQGARVFVNYTSGEAPAQETVRLAKELGAEAEALQFDVASSEAVDKAFDVIKEKAGRLDILVNNAGISRDGLLLRMKDEDWTTTLGVNLNGAFYCSRAAAKVMVRARQGRIVNISSVVGEMGNVGQTPYVSSKAGLIGLTKALAKELAARSITVNAVTPGFIETDMTASLQPELREKHLEVIPLSRYGQASEVASLVAFLSSEDAGYVTGQVIGINGGMYM